MFSAGGTSADEPDPQETNPTAAAATAMSLTIFIILFYMVLLLKRDFNLLMEEQDTHLSGRGKC